MIQAIELMQDDMLCDGKAARTGSSESLRHTDANGIRIAEFTPAYEAKGSAVKNNKAEVKPMMQFKRGMMIVARPDRTSQPLQKQTTQQRVALPRDTSGTVRGVQETQRRFKRGMMVITPLDND